MQCCWNMQSTPCSTPGQGMVSSGRGLSPTQETAEEGVLLLPVSLLLSGALAALILGHTSQHLVGVLPAASPGRLLAPRAHHLSTHSGKYTHGGICGDQTGGRASIRIK